MTRTSSSQWRIGLLITTVAMGIALVISGVSGYRAALQSAEEFTQAELVSMFLGLRQEFRRDRNQPVQVLGRIFEDLQEREVSYVAMLGPNGKPLYEAGAPRIPFHPSHLDPRTRKRPVHVTLLDNGHMAHATVALPPAGRRHGQNMPHRKPPLLLVEMRPVQAIALVDRAFWAMLMEMGAALILLCAAAVFWRMSRRADLISAQLIEQEAHARRQMERDRQLKMLGQMSAVLGHELRNPITALKGHSQLLGESLPTDSRHLPAVQTLIREATHLETLTNHVLEFAKSGALNLSRVYLDDLANAGVTFADCGPVNISIEGNGQTWILDRTRMEQVLVNLITNARQSCPEGPIDLEMSAEHHLTIRVRDRGPGIPEDRIATIFEPFQTTRAKGTGLGLTLARRIVEEHGGTIVGANHPDGGAVFEIKLPKATTE